MNLLFIKANFIIFEIASITLLVISLGALSYFSVIINLKSGMKKENLDIIQVGYESKYLKGVFSDITLTLNENFSESAQSAYIIVNNVKFENETKANIIQKINKLNSTNIFLFQAEKNAKNLISKLVNTLNTSANFSNCAIGFIIILFFVFMKITLVRTSIKKIQLIKSNRISHTLLGPINKDDNNVLFDPSLSLLNKENFFNFCIFHVTYILIIPFLFPNFLDYDLNSYIGFRNNLFSSVILYRTYFGQKDFQSNPNLIGSDNSRLVRFIMHTHDSNDDYEPSQINHYLLNLSFLCCSVWVSQYFNVFNAKQTASSTMEKKKETKLKSFFKLFVIIILFTIWSAFLFFALGTFFDYFYLFHGEIFYSFVKITDPKILFFFITVYYHFYFYILMGIYTLKIIYKNKKYQKDQEVSNLTRPKSDNVLSLLPESDISDLLIDKLEPNYNIITNEN